MITATCEDVLVAIDTATDGFGVLEAIAALADEDSAVVVHLTTPELTVLGTTIGLIDYHSRLGVGTGRIQEDYQLRGPRTTPQFLHLADVEITRSRSSVGSVFRPVHRSRIAEITHSIITV